MVSFMNICRFYHFFLHFPVSCDLVVVVSSLHVKAYNWVFSAVFYNALKTQIFIRTSHAIRKFPQEFKPTCFSLIFRGQVPPPQNVRKTGPVEGDPKDHSQIESVADGTRFLYVCKEKF